MADGRKIIKDDKHRLSDIDPDNLTAICLKCGLTSVGYRPARNRYVCKTATKTNEKYKYGEGQRIPLVEATKAYTRLLEEQQGVCFICGGLPNNGYALALDHCHESGKIRGLLCNLCNTGLGFFKDDSERLRKAAKYLEDHTP